MKKNFFVFAIFMSNFLLAQVKFEKGYYVDKNGEKIDALIKNYGWKSNPTQIEIKSSVDETVRLISAKEIREFEVDGVKYISTSVEIDKSSNMINYLSAEKDFNLTQENLLLKVIAQGNVNLYRYTSGNLTRFFIKNQNEEIKQLLFKEYSIDGTHIQKNEEYKKQLNSLFSVNGKDYREQIEKLSYKENDFLNFFSDVQNTQLVSFNKQNGSFHVYAKPGFGFSKYIVTPVSTSNIPGTKSNELMPRVGFEFEYVFSFNKGKWAIISEPSYQSVKHEIINFNQRDFRMSSSAIQIPLGMKHYMFLNEVSRFYISAALYTNIYLNNENDFKNGNIFYTFAGGYSYKKFGAELRYGATPYFRTTVFGQSSWVSMDGINLALSYQIF